MRLVYTPVEFRQSLYRNIKRNIPSILDKAGFIFEEKPEKIFNSIINPNLNYFFKINLKHENNEKLHSYINKLIDVREILINLRYANRSIFQSLFYNGFEIGGIMNKRNILNYLIVNYRSYQTRYEFNFTKENLKSWKEICKEINSFVLFLWDLLNNFDFDKEIEELEKLEKILILFKNESNLNKSNSWLPKTIDLNKFYSFSVKYFTINSNYRGVFTPHFYSNELKIKFNEVFDYLKIRRRDATVTTVQDALSSNYFINKIAYKVRNYELLKRLPKDIQREVRSIYNGEITRTNVNLYSKINNYFKILNFKNKKSIIKINKNY